MPMNLPCARVGKDPDAPADTPACEAEIAGHLRARPLGCLRQAVSLRSARSQVRSQAQLGNEDLSCAGGAFIRSRFQQAIHLFQQPREFDRTLSGAGQFEGCKHKSAVTHATKEDAAALISRQADRSPSHGKAECLDHLTSTLRARGLLQRLEKREQVREVRALSGSVSRPA